MKNIHNEETLQVKIPGVGNLQMQVADLEKSLEENLPQQAPGNPKTSLQLPYFDIISNKNLSDQESSIKPIIEKEFSIELENNKIILFNGLKDCETYINSAVNSHENFIELPAKEKEKAAPPSVYIEAPNNETQARLPERRKSAFKPFIKPSICESLPIQSLNDHETCNKNLNIITHQATLSTRRKSAFKPYVNQTAYENLEVQETSGFATYVENTSMVS